MKFTLSFFAVLITPIILFGQGFGTVDINNISATVNTSGSQFWDLQQSPLFEAPKGSGLSPIFASSLWVAGVDVSNQLKVAGSTFNSNGSDFFPGPILSPGVGVSSSSYQVEMPKWEKVWVLTQAEIQNFVDYYNCGFDPNCDQNISFPGYSIPQNILDWPAHGDTAIGQAFYLAPFIDRNGNGIYEPTQGDIPKIKGHQAAYFIMNDEGGIHGSGGYPIGIEVHCMAYSFACTEQSLDNTLFFNYRIINRSTFTLTDFYAGIWTDGDLGNPMDDYIGSDVGRSAYYFYNGDALDEDNAGALGYQQNLAAQGVTFLGGVPQDFDGFDNAFGIGQGESPNGIGYGDAIVDNERLGLTSFLGLGSNSSNFIDIYNAMTSRMSDGSHTVYGGNGHYLGCAQPFSCVHTQFMFPGNSDALGYGTSGIAQPNWNEINSGNTPGDRKSVGTSGPITLSPGLEFELDIAYVFAQKNATDPVGQEVDMLLTRIDSVRSYFMSDQYPCFTPILLSQENARSDFKSTTNIYPNPSSDFLNVSSNETIDNVIIFNALGKEVYRVNVAQSSMILNLKELSDGIYFIELRSENQILTKKFIKY
ncbi:MAG: T9SS type A sorting domain-containing protein [Flavobacteriales bacterium]|nr:T9SS type A sorting domain-containing protein [Flavobacteriales bacterium]